MYLRIPLPPDYRVLVYARYWKDEQLQQSIADQDDFCQEFLSDNGAKPKSSQLLSDSTIGMLNTRLLVFPMAASNSSTATPSTIL